MSKKNLAFFLIIMWCIICGLGCSTDAPSDSDTTDTDDTETTIAAIVVSASSTTISPGETTTVMATAYNSSGNSISGVTIYFTIDDPTLAYITGSSTTNSSGVAEVYLTARDNTGEVLVAASSSDDNASDTLSISVSDGTTPSVIDVTISPVSIVVQGTASVEAEVLDENGDPVSDGTSVSFSVDNATYGYFTSETDTTTNGFAYATFAANDEQGTASITVQSGNVSEQADITIYPAEATSIEFVSADPQLIAIKGSGGTETSTIQFVVNDSNGNPVEGVKVSFVMSGPGGGEAIDHTPNDATPEAIEISSDSDGLAEVILSSGSVVGPVTIMGTITVTDSSGNTIEISSQSSTISIGGGLPSAKRFSVAATTLNLPGLVYNNIETTVTAYLADRFGNYNILEGTTVSFVSEIGLAIDTSDVTVDDDGLASSVARTQTPAGSNTVAEDVAEDAWETTLLSYIQSTYGVSLPGHPRDGVSTIMVYVKGEEHFQDENANGVYDSGETFTDTEDDPFVDYNDDDLRDDGSLDPFEEYIDSNGDGTWDGTNGVWDSDKNIFYNFNILLTGTPYLIASSAPTFTIPDGGSLNFTIIVCDRNGNMLTEGSSITVNSSVGALIGTETYDFLDTNSPGPLELSYTLMDDNVGDSDAAKTGYVTVEYTWEGTDGTMDGEVYVGAGTVD
jgi:hypothetical protein